MLTSEESPFLGVDRDKVPQLFGNWYMRGKTRHSGSYDIDIVDKRQTLSDFGAEEVYCWTTIHGHLQTWKPNKSSDWFYQTIDETRAVTQLRCTCSEIN